jgi:hypothetical protein
VKLSIEELIYGVDREYTVYPGQSLYMEEGAGAWDLRHGLWQ